MPFIQHAQIVAELSLRFVPNVPSDDDYHDPMRNEATSNGPPTLKTLMSDKQLRIIASPGLVVGALLGIAGTFVPSTPLRELAWGLDGVALVVASALLTILHFRAGQDLIAAGFIVFAVGEGLILSGAAMDLVASVPAFGAGAGLWATALALISSSSVMPSLVRGFGFIASVLFATVAVKVFAGRLLTPLSAPFPFTPTLF